MKKFLLLILSLCFILSGCNAQKPKLGVTPRQTLPEEEREAYLDQLDRQGLEEDIYNEDGIIINASRYIEISAWKLNILAAAYEKQNDAEYITNTKELTGKDEYWMAHRVTTEDFQFDVKLTGNDDTMTLDIQLIGEHNFIIVPRGCIINGVLKNTALFKGAEPEKGHFVITAQMSDFEALSLFGVTMENISSIAWLLTAINIETQEMHAFLLASAFPVSEAWEGIQVAEKFSVDSGIVMWIARSGGVTYLCTFNGSEEKIFSDVTVTAEEGSIISNLYTLDISSGEFSYIMLGYDVAGVQIYLEDVLLHSDK